MRKVVDVILFNNELELLDLRVKILEDVVDYFIIKESNQTFQGDPKEVVSLNYKHPKVKSMIVEFPGSLSTWERERYQRCVTPDFDSLNLTPEDIIMTSDLDEVPHPGAVTWMRDNFNPDAFYAFDQKMYQYFLNVRNLDEEWSGTRASSLENYFKIDPERLRHSKHLCLNIQDAGWHWSFLGGEKMIESKIRSYSHEEYDNEETISKIKERLLNNEDVFNRGFTLQVEELDDSYPSYILENQDKLSHLIKH